MCGEKYPDQPLNIKFQTKINMNCVDSRGGVLETWPYLAKWRRDYTIAFILEELRRELASAGNRKVPQPVEGTTY